MAEAVRVIGAGLAGCEAAYQLAKSGVSVELYEMKPTHRTPAHQSNDYAELCCSNSLRSNSLQNGVGLLKEEMRLLGSLVLEAADKTRVPAGGALAVDRNGFSRYITEAIEAHPNIKVIHERVAKIPGMPAIIATGPLTEGDLAQDIEALLGERLHFFDAAAPIVAADSLNYNRIFRASRYGRGSDYLNCPMSREEYFRFVHELANADTARLHDFETNGALKVFEGCMPVEEMAKRGQMTLAFGPLKPVGLADARTGEKPFAVVQLRQDDAQGMLFNLVGFQTNLLFGEQKRVFGLIPGLESARFLRYGVMHRNTYIRSPKKFNWDYGLTARPGLYFAGQITGVEGYVESASSGLAAGVNMARFLRGQEPVDFTRRTAMGALAHYMSGYTGKDFQPMNINFGLIESLEGAPRNKQARYAAVAGRALSVIHDIIEEIM